MVVPEIFSVVGINHRTAPLAIREQVAINKDGMAESLHILKSFFPSAVIVSTCNRTEVYWVGPESSETAEKVTGFLNRKTAMSTSQFSKQIYIKQSKEAIRHLYRIAGGLDSMIIGEYEILGQLKDALRSAENAGSVTYPLRFIFQGAIRTARRVREQTAISRLPLSISSVAVDLAEKVIGNLSSSKILVIGAGEAGRLVVKAARMKGIGSILVASKSLSHASEIARRVDGSGVDIRELAKILPESDVVVTCADSRHRVVTVKHLEEAMRVRAQRPLVVIDVAVPRNVQPEARTVPNVSLYNIDDLNAICEQNRELREREVHKAEAMIETEVAAMDTWWHGYQVRPVIVALMERAENVRSRLLKKTMNKLSPLTEEDRYSLEMMTRALVKRILSSPLAKLKMEGTPAEEYAVMVRRLFEIDTEEECRKG